MLIRCARAALALVLAAGPMVALHAQNGLNELAHNMKMLDKNFDAADKNHDGVLDRQEAQAVPFVAKHFDAIDVNKRGVVSKDDVHNYVVQALKRTSKKPASSSSTGSP